MTTVDVKRKLTTIMAADVAAFSRMVAENEEDTIAALRTHRSERIDPVIHSNGGRIANTAGDSLLVEFPSVINAVRCAIEIQDKMVKWNREVSHGQRIVFRIGLHLGDVIEQGRDLLGDGVNIAARLENIAEPGGIVVSSAVYEQVSGRIDASFSDLGKQTLKNMPGPVHAYAVNLNSSPANATSGSSGKIKVLTFSAIVAAFFVVGEFIWWAAGMGEWITNPWSQGARLVIQGNKPSIAVLPFVNRSGDKSQEYFSDGLTADIITDLSMVSGLFVIAQGSSFQHRGRELDVVNVGRKLGVSHMLTGSVRSAGGHIRINVQLIETKSGKHIWGARYDGELKEVFTLQDKITEKIVNALEVKLTDGEKVTIRHAVTNSVEAYDEFLKGRREFGRASKQGNEAAKPFFKRAIELDPQFADAHALLAWTYLRGSLFSGGQDPDNSLVQAERIAKHAVKLGKNRGVPYLVLGLVQLFQLKHLEAISSVERALALNPNDANGYATLAFVLNYAGFPEKAEKLIETAIRLNPQHPYRYFNIRGQAYFLLGRYKQAVEQLSLARSRNPNDAQVMTWLAAAEALVGNADEAKWIVEELLSQDPGYTIKKAVVRFPFKNRKQVDRLASGLRKAGLPG